MVFKVLFNLNYCTVLQKDEPYTNDINWLFMNFQQLVLLMYLIFFFLKYHVLTALEMVITQLQEK